LIIGGFPGEIIKPYGINNIRLIGESKFLITVRADKFVKKVRVD
jgi:hypothetical protein